MSAVDRFQRLAALFSEASQLEPAAREAFLRERCDDPALLDEAIALCRADQQPPGVLDLPAFDGGIIHESLQHTRLMPQGHGMPERVGRYRVIRIIGEGGMGTVYEAEQDNPRRRVALKIIRAGMASRQMAQRFRQEAQILGRLQHSGIAQILEAGAIDDNADARPFYAMELVQGLPLLEYARAHNLGVRERVEIVAALCDAVQHAHDQGVIHRDLKPANILVHPAHALHGHGAHQPKILDFGVARATDSDMQTVTLRTSMGELVGTVPYMSPEQASGDPSQVDWRCDVYALGVILFELLSGRLPHDVSDCMVHEALRIIRESDATRLGSVDRQFRGDLETIAAKALAPEKVRRYQSAAELAADLRRFLADEPIAARPSSTMYQLRKFARRNKTLVSGVAVGLLLMLAGTALAIWQAVAATHARGVAESNSTLASQREAEALWQAYRATIAAAAAALEAHDPTTARQRLLEIKDELRGWEWHVLFARLDESETLLNRGWPAIGVGVSADGSRALLLSGDGELREMNLATGALESSIRLPLADIRQCSFSDDGMHAVLVHGDGALGVWQRGADPSIRGLPAPGGRVLRVAISRGGRYVAAAAGDRVVIWDMAGDGQPRVCAQELYPASIAFSRDGSRLIITVADVLRTVNCETGQAEFWGHFPNTASCVQLIDDHRFGVMGGRDKLVRVIDLANRADIEAYAGHLGSISALAMTDDESLVASASDDQTLRLWRRGLATPIAVRHMPPGVCRDLRFVESAKRLLTRDGHGDVRLWAINDDAHVLTDHGSYVYGLAFAPDGSRFVSGSWDGTVRIWDARTLRCQRAAGGEQREPYVASVAVSPDSQTLAAGYHRGPGQSATTRLWNMQTGALLLQLPPGIGEVRALAFSRDGSILAAGHTHESLTFWNMRDPEAPRATLEHVGRVHCVAFSHDGRRFATSHDGGAIRVWDLATSEVVTELLGHDQSCRTIAFSPDDRLLASASDDGTARLWDIAAGRCRAVMARHWDHVYALAFSPDGRRLVTGSRDTTIRIWSVSDGAEVAQLRGHRDYIYALAFSPDGSMLASGSGDSTVRIWDSLSASQRRQAGTPTRP